MKRCKLFIGALLIVGGLTAQKDVTNAYNANKSGDYDAAVGYIEKAIGDGEAAAKEKTWRYRGEIYRNIAIDKNFSSKYPEAINKSVESYLKAMELDTRKDYIAENRDALGQLQGILQDKGSKLYDAKDFCGAADMFGFTARISESFGLFDTTMIYYNAMCLDFCGKLEDALAGYRKVAAKGYMDATVSINISEIFQKLNRVDEAKTEIAAARKRNPNNGELLVSEVNFLLADQKYGEAMDVLKKLTTDQPNNETYWFVLGVTCEKVGKMEEQLAAYQKALEIKPDYFDAAFNLGAAIYNQGVEKYKECDAIPPRESARYDACVAETNDIFSKSIAHLEKAFALRSTDSDIINALKEAYVRVGNMEGKKRMEDALRK